MSWQGEAHLLPSRNRPLLESLIGRRIMRVVHYLEQPADELLDDDSYEHVTRQELFSKAGAPAVVTLDDGREICVSLSEELVSMTICLADSAVLRADWSGPVDATDPQYADPSFAAVVGRTIERVRVFQIAPPHTPFEVQTPAGVRVLMPGILSRPREAAIAFEFDDATQLVFSNALVDVPNSFAITLAMTNPEVPITEMLCVGPATRGG